MIVKENVLLGYGGTHIVEARNKGTASDNFNYKQIDIPTNLKENQKYTLCFKLKQLNGSGEFSIMLYNKGNTKSAGGAKLQVDDERMYFNFVYRAGITERILIYNDLSGQTRDVGLELKDIILVEGQFAREGNEIVYLPHEQDVKPENQAIFPIGGGITKSTLYRGYKGVSLC